MKIPNQEYWLAPDRIEQIRHFFRRQMTTMGVAHLMLAVYSIQLVINANFDQTPSLHKSIFWALALYFIFTDRLFDSFFLHVKRHKKTRDVNHEK